MTEHNFKDTLGEIVGKVFEQTAFLFPEPADLLDGISFDDFELILVNLQFAGAREGEVRLIIPLELCRELTANLLGEDMGDIDERDKSIDAAKEILNIITGQLLTEIYGQKAVFDLKSPQVQELTREELFSSLEGKDYICRTIDDYPIIATLTVNSDEYEHKSISS
jgi:chemotaxis protein CheY-P-specific phosphatase CheC